MGELERWLKLEEIVRKVVREELAALKKKTFHILSADQTPIVEKLPLRDGSEFEVHESLIKQLEPIYPSVDVPATVREMRGWLLLNTDRRKTRRGISRFIGKWLQSEQEKHGG